MYYLRSAFFQKVYRQIVNDLNKDQISFANTKVWFINAIISSATPFFSDITYHTSGSIAAWKKRRNELYNGLTSIYEDIRSFFFFFLCVRSSAGEDYHIFPLFIHGPFLPAISFSMCVLIDCEEIYKKEKEEDDAEEEEENIHHTLMAEYEGYNERIFFFPSLEFG